MTDNVYIEVVNERAFNLPHEIQETQWAGLWLEIGEEDTDKWKKTETDIVSFMEMKGIFSIFVEK